MISEWWFSVGLPTWALFLEIFLAGAVVVLAGSRLAKLADSVAEEYGLGGAWVGALLLATVTSLPEVVSGVTATWVGQTDMAFSAIFGSCSFNIVLIVVLNWAIGGGSILSGKGGTHSLGSSFGIVLTSLVLMGILLVDKFQANPAFANTCEIAVMILIVVGYVVCMRLVFRAEQVTTTSKPDTRKQRTPGLMLKVAGVSAAMVISAWWLARTGDVLADHPIEMIGGSLGATFVGFLFLAIATSLPEIATGLAAVRLGNLDMALGNIFGSNMFNIFVIPMLKVASMFRGDGLLMAGENFNPSQSLIAGVLPILLTGVVVGSLSYASRRTILRRFGLDSALLAAIYMLGMVLLLSSG